jgi:diaminopimelate decarboxylase
MRAEGAVAAASVGRPTRQRFDDRGPGTFSGSVFPHRHAFDDPTMTLPGHPWIARRDGTLHVDEVDLAALAREHGTPLYVYSRRAMLDALARYERAFGKRPHLVCYAMKANSSLAVLQTFVNGGCGIDIVSVGELERALAAGASPSKIVFSGVGKRDDELRRALEVGVRGFNVESVSELHALSRMAQAAGKRARISLRVNPDIDAGTHPYISTGLKANKFGIAHDQALEVYRLAWNLPRIEVAGIDCHIGSQITEVGPYLAAVDRVLDLVEAVERSGIRLHHLDFGGGLGIVYDDETPPAADDLITQLLAHVDRRGHGHREILVEPGRSLVGNAGVLLTKTLVLKPGAEKNFCIVDAAMNDLMRPAMYQAWMRIEAVRPRDAAKARRYDVVGPVCESGDWLGRDRDLAIDEGDLLAVLSAGAYGMAMASNYNTRARAAEVMVDGARHWLVRRRETVQELFAHEQLVPDPG